MLLLKSEPSLPKGKPRTPELKLGVRLAEPAALITGGLVIALIRGAAQFSYWVIAAHFLRATTKALTKSKILFGNRSLFKSYALKK